MRTMNRSIVAWTTLLVSATAFAQSNAPLPAFPGAEGFGAVATGGRGKPVVEVTNLNDSGPGSLREALNGGDRTIVFRVSGTINLQKRIDVAHPNITIAGQTAPGDGICLRGKELMIRNTQNVIVRFIRSRPGDELKQEHDALTVWNSQKVIIDHCSLSWSTDSVSDVVKGSRDVTIQWSIISEPLNLSVHQKGRHGYGTGWGHGSYHHNLIAHCESRAPRLAAEPTRGLTDFRNNVIYNWGGGGSYGGEHADIDFVGNYFRPGPSTQHTDSFFNAWNSNTRIFLSGNVMEGNPEITSDNVKGLITKGSIWKDPVDLKQVPVSFSFHGAKITTTSAEEALEQVLQYAGASLSRDAVDQRVINDVKNRTGSVINSPTDVGGWPELRSLPAPSDRDKDGMPDDWETKHGLNPDDAQDGQAVAPNGGGYTNLEIYLNELAEPAMPKMKPSSDSTADNHAGN